MEPLIAEVAVPLPVDRTFDYLLPPPLQGAAAVGKRVRVRFGREVLVGYIVALKGESAYPGKLSPILEVLDPEPVVDEQGWALARWLAEYYLAPLGLVLKAISPVKPLPSHAVRPRPRACKKYHVKLAVPLEEALRALDSLKGAPKQVALLRALLALEGPSEASELLRLAGAATPEPLQALRRKGLIELEERRMSTSPPKLGYQKTAPRARLTEGERAALERVTAAIGQGRARAFLLWGPSASGNGSGKAEIYLRAVAQAVGQGREAIVVVPEISLTPQLVARFRGWFGERVALFHSGLTDRERAGEWSRMRAGLAQVAIGVRAVIFAPFRRLGLIVIDGEHEPTYKEELQPRYHLREVALERAKLAGATVLLGSATPSLESYWLAKQGKALDSAGSLPVEVELLELREWAVNRGQGLGRSQVEVEVVDMREEPWGEVFSRRLKEALAERLSRGEQALLILNRRGFSAALCRRCRRVLRCPSCAIPLVYHLKGNQLRCHYCGYLLERLRCQECGFRELQLFGLGLEQAELELRRLFPDTRVRRMDSDAVRRGEHGLILEAFRQGRIEVLLGTHGTTLASAWLDFPNVTLVGLVSADATLSLPDFRAAERTFQLILQAVERVGRSPKGGGVIVQTNHPEHYAIRLAAKGDYHGFLRQELRFREELGYPPFSKLIRVTVEGRKEAKARKRAERLGALLLTQAQVQDGGFTVLGPAREPPLRGLSRWQLLLKGRDPDKMRRALRAALEELGLEGIKIDVDPLA